MQYSRIKGIEKNISRIVLGTMCSLENENEMFELFDCAYEQGITTFDCAPVYSGGRSEIILGKWIKMNNLQDKVFVITKCAHPNPYRKRVSNYDILSDLEDSLARTGLDYFDMYLLHRDDESVPVSIVVETLNRIYDTGRIKCFGGSNWTHKRIETANEYAEKFGLKCFDATSPNYSLARQIANPWGAWADGCVSATGDENKAARDYYQNNQMPIFAYSSLGHGLFSGKVSTLSIEEAKKNMAIPGQIGYLYEENLERLRRAEKLADKYNVSVAQIALAFLLHQKCNIFPIVGAMTKGEIKDCVASLNVKITNEELEWLDLVGES